MFNFNKIKNYNGVLSKQILANGNKISVPNMIAGRCTQIGIENLKDFDDKLNQLEINEAIILGVNENQECIIVAKSILEQERAKYPGLPIIDRTKNNFQFEKQAVILFDIDPDKDQNIKCNSYEEVLEILYKLDSQFENAEILIRHGSSSYLYKESELIKGAGSYHVYIMANNTDNLSSYINALKAKSFEVGCGYYKITSSGSILERYFFDSAVFSPERLVYEAGMVCEKPYYQKRPESFYRQGSEIDCNRLPTYDIDKSNKEKAIKRASIQELAKKIKSTFIAQEIPNVMDRYKCTKEVAEEKLKKMIDKQKLDLYHKIKLDDDTEISIMRLCFDLEKYNKVSCYDPIEKEKGKNKAMIFSNNGILAIHSFLHGGIVYSLEIDFDSIQKIANAMPNEKDNTKNLATLKNMVNYAKLDARDREEIGALLKKKKMIKSKNFFQYSSIEKIQDNKASGYNDLAEDGSILPTAENLKNLLYKNEFTFSYDVIKNKLEICHKDLNKTGPNYEAAAIDKIEMFAAIEGISKTIVEKLSAIANSCYSNPLLDNVQKYAKLYSTNEEQIDYIQAIANTIKTKVNNQYLYEVLKHWLLQCVAAWDYERTSAHNKAKEKFESLLVLQGSQGIRKSDFYAALFPENLKHYFKDNSLLTLSDKDSIIQNTCYGVVELGELDSTFMRSDNGALKAFLSQQFDEYRAPYAQNAMKHKRTTSFCASVNEANFLKDPTGSRRFWVIPVISIDFEEYEKINKEMLWGQVYSLYEQKNKWWFDKNQDKDILEEMENLHKLHSSYSIVDEVIDMIEKSTDSKSYLTATKIFANYNISNPKKNELNELCNKLYQNGVPRNSRGEFFVPQYYRTLQRTNNYSEDSNLIENFVDSDQAAS